MLSKGRGKIETRKCKSLDSMTVVTRQLVSGPYSKRNNYSDYCCMKFKTTRGIPIVGDHDGRKMCIQIHGFMGTRYKVIMVEAMYYERRCLTLANIFKTTRAREW